ncbi:MAG TPA: hypothetical protein VGJ06_09310 [Candidatus Acidoferrum sp.]
MILTLAAVPFTPPPATSILSFAVVINSVSLTPSSGGGDINIPLNASTYGVDLTRLQSDSSFLGQSINSIPVGTYSKLSVNLSAVVTYCAATISAAGCNTGSVAKLSKSFATPTASNFSLSLSGNEQAALRILINFNNGITVNANTQAVTDVDLTATSALTTINLPPAASTLSTGQLDYVDDVTGVVTAASSDSVTIQTATRGSITSLITSSSIGSPNCVIGNQLCTPKVGQVASIDATLNSDGTTTLLQFDPLTTTSEDLVEGIVTTLNTSSTQFQIVTNDYVPANSGSGLGSNLSLGDVVNVTLSNSVLPFVIDTKGLPVVNSVFGGSTSATDILPGQTVLLHVTDFTGVSGNKPASATVDALVLRFTRVAGSVSAPPAPNFSIQSLPPFFGISSPIQVQLGTGSPSTVLDGYTDTGSFAVGDNVAIRALYFGSSVAPSFTAAKVRKN